MLLNLVTLEEWEIPLIVSTVLIVLIAVSLFSTLYVMYRKRHPWLVKYIIQYHARNIDDCKYTLSIST